MQKHARKRIPGMTQLLSKHPDRFSYGVWPGYYERAKGAEIWDIDGNRYVDMSIGGIGANILGYQDPDIDRAVFQAISKGSSSTLNCVEEVELADLLCDIHPWADKVRFGRSGGEAMAMAVRIARAFTGKDKVAFCGYHGWHDWYLAANLSEDDALDGHLLGGLEPAGVPAGLRGTAIPFKYNDISSLEDVFRQNPGEIGTVVMEPIRNKRPKNDFLNKVRTIVNENKAVLIIDEISAGFRLCCGGAHLLFDLVPDIAVFSKALGNGYPMSAVIGNSEVMEAAKKTFISSTNWTERTGPVAALAMIKKFKERNVSAHLIRIGKKVQKGWRTSAEKFSLPLIIEGIEPLSHFAFLHESHLEARAFFTQLMCEKGFLASNSCYSMYAHTDKQVKEYLEFVDEAFEQIARAFESGDIAGKLVGKPAVAGFTRLT